MFSEFHWWQVRLLLFPCSVLTLKFTSAFQERELGSALDSVTRATDTTVIRGITVVTTGTIHTERITTVAPHTTGTTGIEFTIATIAIIITTTVTKLT